MQPTIPEPFSRGESIDYLGTILDDIAEPQTWQTFDDGPKPKRGELARIFHGSFDEVLPDLLRMQELGAGVFITVNQTDTRGRSAENIVALRALFIDGDGIPTPATWPIEPTIIVRRAADRWHAYWLLKPGEPLAAFKDAQKRLAAYYGSDPAIHDLPRVMRVPGFWHLKDPNRPVMVRVERCHPARVYTISDVLAKHPVSDRVLTDTALREASVTDRDAPIIEGGRNHALTSIAGHLRRVGLGERAIEAALVHVNRERCRPPLDTSEVHQIARSVSDYNPDPVAAMVASGFGANKPVTPTRAPDLIAEFHTLRTPIIDGFLRETEVANVIAPPKSRKSWLVADLALSVVTGTMWLGMPCAQGSVLLIDNELHQETLAKRLRIVAEARGLKPDEYDNLWTWCLRGQVLDITQIAEPLTKQADVIRPKLIVFDALYRFVPKGTDENSNGDATAIYNLLDSIAARTRAALVVIHHASKGNQSGKDVTDVGAGAGAMSRAADAHLVLRAHEEPDAAVLEAVCRSFKGIQPMGIRWEHPRWKPDGTLDLEAVKGRPKPKKRDRANIVVEPEEFAELFVGSIPRAKADILSAAESGGMSLSRAEHVLQTAVDRRIVWQHQRAHTGQSATYSTTPPADPRSKWNAVAEYLRNKPNEPAAIVAGIFGCSERYVRDVRKDSRRGGTAPGTAPEAKP